jgi:dipeptidyl aminopeptidase/acylaminoacyl peptidase
VVYLHGGPITATRNSWRRDIQGLVLGGFDVLALNYRGSTGFGPAFRKEATLNLGVKDIEDVVAAGEWLRKREGIDPARIGLMGASYGGYLTLWTMVQAPDAFRCAAALVPIVDWTRHYELADASFRYYGDYFFGGSPAEKPDLYRERSPSSWVDQLAGPILVSAGRNDPRCPFPPIEDFVARARELGKEVEFDVQETEGHGAGRKTSAIEREMTILRFLRDKLA